MFKIFRYFKNLYFLNERLTAEREMQGQSGYEITFTQDGPEHYITYREDGKEISILAEFSILNDVKLFTNSVRKWNHPTDIDISESEHKKVIDRLIQYFSCWGEVVLDDSFLGQASEPKESLIKDGIPFRKSDGFIIYQNDIEKERKRKGGIVDR